MISRKKMANGFEYIEIQNEAASANIAFQGAHIFHYARNGEKAILWLSDISDFEYGKAIRGGVPICWPWFGQHKTKSHHPQHGFARTAMFELIESMEMDSKTTQITLKLKDSEDSFSLWQHHFELLLVITVSDKLSMELITSNLDEKPFEITQALHSYFDVSHISNVKIEGLESKPYFDALTKKERKQDGLVTFSEEVDRVYNEVNGVVTIVDECRTIKVQNEGSSSAVVWNPWIEKCKRMSAMNDDAYETFVCIESANALDDFKLLQSQESHTLKATIY